MEEGWLKIDPDDYWPLGKEGFEKLATQLREAIDRDIIEALYGEKFDEEKK